MKNIETKKSVNEKSNNLKILRGEKKTVPLSDFRKMRLMRNYQVESFSSAVLSNTVSFKGGLEEIVKEQERRDVVVNISRIMMKPIDFVKQKFGDQLTKNNLDKFRGAKLGKDRNERGK